jgi:hypothetical protein
MISYPSSFTSWDRTTRSGGKSSTSEENVQEENVKLTRMIKRLKQAQGITDILNQQE